MKRYPLLEVCARIEGHDIQHQLLRDYCAEFADWQGLLEQAEREGMSTLLWKHLLGAGIDVPISVKRSLAVLYKRHQHNADVRLRVIEDLLQIFAENDIDAILMKGSALCTSLYPDPALRPMRDIDILVRKEHAELAQGLLTRSGFVESTAPIPADHHHLPSLYKTVDDVKMCVELHRGLYPDITPHYPAIDFDAFLDSARKVRVGKTEALVFGHEEMLHYLYQHAFHAPLTYEPYKLISAADIISYVEKYFAEINWQELQERFPAFRRALPLMHYISPWNFNKIPQDFLPASDRRHRFTPKPYRGWPRQHLRELKQETSMSQIIKETFLPSRWWMAVYYGETGIAGYIKSLATAHLKQIYLFARLYRSWNR